MNRLSRRPMPWMIAAGVGSAVAANLIVFAVGHVAGGTFEFSSSGELRTVDVWTVVGFTSFPLALGLGLVAAVAHFWSDVVRVARWLAVVLCVVTIFVMTVPADFDTASTLALSASHLTLIPIIVVVLAEIERRSCEVNEAAMSATVR